MTPSHSRSGLQARPVASHRAGTIALWALALVFLTAFLFVPLAAVFTEALAEGADAYLRAVTEPEAWNAIRLTLVTAAIVVPLNLVFGVAAAWVLARFEFRGRRVLVALIELPFAVSPVVSGLVFVLLFGAQGFAGPWLAERDIRVIFAVPGIVLATLFVTVPFVARELIPVLEALFPARTTAEWLVRLQREGVPVAPINTVDQVVSDPQVRLREMVVDLEHPTLGTLRTLGTPVRAEGAPPFRPAPPRALGEDTAPVLRELLGYSPERIDLLRQRRVIA